ncbi:MAG: sugar phosphate isomerase/epimerase family protein [Anaerolineae bacterium]|jgi:sugar phosphate isomerase/epimerase
MKLGISSWTYTWAIGVNDYAPPCPLTPVDLVDKAVGLGVQVIQVADNLPLHSLSVAQRQALALAAAQQGIELEVGAKGLTIQNVRRYIGIAGELGSRLLRIIVDSPGDTPEPDEIIRRLESLLPALDTAGVTLGIENHDRMRARDLAAVVQRVDSARVGICLDTVNSFGALEGPEVVVNTLAPYVVNLHLKDFAIFRAAQMMGFIIQGRPLGQGRTDIPWLLQTLADRGRDVNAIIELWTPDQGAVDANIALEARWAAESVAHARQYIAG